jgi:hypothetical protein
MRVLDRSVYVGPSLYAHFPVIRLELDLGELEQWPTARLGPAFIDGLLAALPGLQEHGCSYGEPGGFVRRMREDEGTWLGHVLEHVAIELQNIAGEHVTFGKTRSAGPPGVYTVVYEYAERQEGIAAGELGLRLLWSLLPEKLRPADALAADWNWPEARDEFIRYAQRRALGPSTASLVRAAEARDIPWLRLNDQSLVQLGHGKYQQRIQATVTGRTPHISVELASDKEETNKILGTLGTSRPAAGTRAERRPGRAGRSPHRLSGGDQALQRQPWSRHLDPAHDRTRTSHTASRLAREHSRSVIVETFLEGDDHRLLVVNGELVAATRRTPGHVVGDGVHDIAELIDIVNQDPRRGVGHEKVLTRLDLDAQAQKMLERVDMTPQSVPAPGQVVYLRSTANLSTGGTATDVTDVIHPDNREMAVRAVRAGRARRGRSRFPVEGHHRELPRHRRRHLRSERRAWIPHARRTERRHAARCRGPGHRHAVPVRNAVARADRCDHGYQWQDDDVAHAVAPDQDGWLHAGPHDHGRRVHRRASHRAGRHDRSRSPRAWCSPIRRSTSRSSRLRAAACCARAWACPRSTSAPVLNVQSDHLGLKGIETLEQLSRSEAGRGRSRDRMRGA